MPPKEFPKLEKIFRDLYNEGRIKELLRLAFKLLKLERGSGKLLSFLLFRLPGDTVFAHKASAPGDVSRESAVFFRLAELCRDKRAFREMDRLLARCLREERDELLSFLARCLLGEPQKAYALVPALLRKKFPPEMLLLAADPWRGISRPARVRRALAGAGAALKDLRGPAKLLASVHRFILAEKTAPAPAFRRPGRIPPGSAIFCVPAAEVLLNRLEFKKAESLFRLAAADCPASEQACGKLAETIFCSGRQREALDFMAAKQAVIRSPGFRAWRGQLLLFFGRYKEAAAELEGPIAAGNALGWCWRGAALFKLGLHGPALKDLETAVAIDAEDLEARVWRAELFRSRKEYAKSREELARVLKLMPSHPWALANLALLAAGRGDAASFSAACGRLPAGCFGAGRNPGPAALEALLGRLGGVRRHEPRFFHRILRA